MRNRSALRSNAAVRNGWGSGRGFTIVELMITLTVAAVLFAVAIPSFRRITLTNRLSTAADDVVVALRTARMEAIKGNSGVLFCSDSATDNAKDATLGATCGAAASVVGLVTSPDGKRTPTKLREGMAGVTAPVQFKSGMKALRFNPQGLAFLVGSNALFDEVVVVDICTDDLSSDNHRIVRMKSGSTLQTELATGTCAK